MTGERPYDAPMSLGDHLDDLRRRLIYCAIGVAAGMVLMLFVSKWLIGVVCQPLLYQMAAKGIEPSFELPTMTSGFTVYIRVAFAGALVLGLPWLLYQAWRFIAPGLYKHEQRFVVMLLPGSALLSVVGIVFMHFVMLPATAWFMVDFSTRFDMPDLKPTVVQKQFNSDEAIAPLPVSPEGTPLPRIPSLLADPVDPPEFSMWVNAQERAIKYTIGGKVYVSDRLVEESIFQAGFHISEYISFVTMAALAFAITFQLPLVMLMIGWTRLVSAAAMARGRKYVVIGCLVVGMLLTPPDPISQIALAVPMYVLFEFGLILVRLTVRERKEPADAEA